MMKREIDNYEGKRTVNAIERLIESDLESPKSICVIGDAMADVWIDGERQECQEGCVRFNHRKTTVVAGGAANAARQLCHWNSKTNLIAPIQYHNAFDGVNDELCIPGHDIPYKTRYIDQEGRVVFRSDVETRKVSGELRLMLTDNFYSLDWNGILISDYDKGFLGISSIRGKIEHSIEFDIPCVVDPKKHPRIYQGAILKTNAAYLDKFHDASEHVPGCVVTFGGSPPIVLGEQAQPILHEALRPVRVKNIVGAGDCFAAHMTLALAHGLDLHEAVRIAHSAGRLFVQNSYERPPWPHEIRKDLDPVAGKVLRNPLAALRQSDGGRIVFTNGVFRIPHAGHAWLMNWAKKQGDTLVVGINDDASAARQKPGQVVLSLEERIAVLAAMECVDWIVPFSEDEPNEIMKILKPDALVKGSEYTGSIVPGHDLVKEVLFAPDGPFLSHASHLVEKCRTNF